VADFVADTKNTLKYKGLLGFKGGADGTRAKK